MAHNKVYVTCENMCLEEGMTKSDILTRITSLSSAITKLRKDTEEEIGRIDTDTVLKSAFAVLTGDITFETKYINYPEGFTKDNTVIVGVQVKQTGNVAWRQMIKKNNDEYSYLVPEIWLGSNEIILNSTISTQLYYKILLMRTDLL